MKKMLLMFLFVMFVTNIIHAGAFAGANSFVVVRLGDGIVTLANAGMPVFLDEYDFTGTLLQTIAIPPVGTPNFVINGTASSEGYMTLSADQNLLALSGYNAAVAAGSATTTAAATNRVIATVNAAGTVSFVNTLTESVASGNFRGVVTSDGNKFWMSTSTTGVRYTTAGSATSLQLNAVTTNDRCINIFNGTLYVGSGSAPHLGPNTLVGIGTPVGPLPTTSPDSLLLLQGFPTLGTHSPYAFSMNPAGNIIYVADDGAVGSGGGIQKWTSSDAGATWTLAYTLVPSTFTGFRGLTVCWQCANPIIFATSNESALNKIYSVTDIGPTSAVNILVAAAGTSKIFRGIALAPPGVCPVELSSFTSIVNGRNINLAWETKTEKNSDKFVIERQTIGANWEAIGSVKAAGLSNSTKQYSFSDKNLNTGNYQYRLKMTDNDGSFTNSSVTEVAVSTPTNFELLQNYPNPFNPSTKISYNLPSDARVTLEVYNVLGVKVGQLVNQDQSAGFYSVDFNSSLNKSISSGVYLYKITAVDKVTGNSFSAIKKMMMLK
jgi:hypothetical protein